MRACVIVGVVVLIAALCAAAPPPKGLRTEKEVKALRAEQKHTLHEKIPNVFDINAAYFHKYIKPGESRKRYWFVVFYATWCHVCDELIEPLTELAEVVHRKLDNEHEVVHKQRHLARGQLSIAKHDVTADEGVAHKYNVEGYPTILLFDRDDGDKYSVYEGPRTSQSFLEFIKKNTDIKNL